MRRYVREVGRLSVADVRARQPAPWINVGHGAAGIAYALWRAGRTTAAARVWREAARRARARDAFSSREARVSSAMTASSLCDGPAGLPFVGALIAHAAGDRAAYPRPARAFATWCAPRDGRPAELLHGTAGLLIGALALARRAGDARMRAIADALAAELLDDPRWRGPGANRSFAHGAPGVVSALCQWSVA